MNRLWMLPSILLLVLFVEEDLQSISMNSVGVSRNAGNWTLTREAILTLRPAAAKLDQSTWLHIVSLGCANSRRGCRGGRLRLKLRLGQTSEIPNERNIPVIINRRRNNGTRYLNSRSCWRSRKYSDSNLIKINKQDIGTAISGTANHAGGRVLPTIYLLNATSLAKPHAMQQLIPLMFRPMMLIL